MNIITAPLRMTAHAFADYDLDIEEVDAKAAPMGKTPIVLAPRTAAAFFAVAAIIAFAVIGVGLYHTILGGPGDLELSAFGIELKTQTAGIALTALGLGFYLLIGKVISSRYL